MAQTATGEEIVLAAVPTSEGIEFQVPSGGCTRKSSFGLEMVQRQPLTVRLVRVRPDYCEAWLPGGTRVTFTYGEIGAVPLPSATERQAIVVVNARRRTP